MGWKGVEFAAATVDQGLRGWPAGLVRQHAQLPLPVIRRLPGLGGARTKQAGVRAQHACMIGVDGRAAPRCRARHAPAPPRCGSGSRPPAQRSAAARPASPACSPGGPPARRLPPPPAAPPRPPRPLPAAAPPSHARCACSGCAPNQHMWAEVGQEGRLRARAEGAGMLLGATRSAGAERKKRLAQRPTLTATASTRLAYSCRGGGEPRGEGGEGGSRAPLRLRVRPR